MAFATGLGTSTGLQKKQVAQTLLKVSDPQLGRARLDGDTPMHSSSLSKYRDEVFTAGGAIC